MPASPENVAVNISAVNTARRGKAAYLFVKILSGENAFSLFFISGNAVFKAFFRAPGSGLKAALFASKAASASSLSPVFFEALILTNSIPYSFFSAAVSAVTPDFLSSSEKLSAATVGFFSFRHSSKSFKERSGLGVSITHIKAS